MCANIAFVYINEQENYSRAGFSGKSTEKNVFTQQKQSKIEQFLIIFSLYTFVPKSSIS